MPVLQPELRTVSVRNIEDIATHFDAWDHLAWEAPQRLPPLLPDWVSAFLQHKLSPSEHWLCCFAYIGDRLVGALPVIITPHRILGSSWPTLRTPSDVLTLSGDVLLACDHAKPAFEALLVELRHQVPHHLSLELKAVRQNSPVWEAVKGGIHGYVVRYGLHSQYSLLNVKGDADSYWSSLGNMRRNVRRYRKKLESRGQVTVEIRKGSAATEGLLAEYIALEASGWKGRIGTAMTTSPFYATLIRNFAARDRWEWHIIRVGERIIALGMGVVCGAALMLPKIAFDEEFADCMPGSLLTAEVIKSGFSRPELDEINHLSNSDWHGLWRMSQDKYVDVYLIRRSIASLLFQLPRVAIRSAYHNIVRPRIPAFVREARRKFKRRGDRKPRRAADSRSAPSDSTLTQD
jgi:predicted N-acyltransferase